MDKTIFGLTVKQALLLGTQQLVAIETARLDCEWMLAELLHVPRSYLHARPETVLDAVTAQQWGECLARRAQGEPLAYIVGHQEFWSLRLNVTRDTLIPRPETEFLVEQVLAYLPADEPCIVADLGTGSGAIALALAYERPHWQIIASDISPLALAVAMENATHLGLTNVQFMQGAWCQALPQQQKLTAIVSNPPYIAPADPHLHALSYEPQSALVADQQGLADLATIIQQAKAYLISGGWLMLEHGYNQAVAVQDLLHQAAYFAIEIKRDYGGNDRVAIAAYS